MKKLHLFERKKLQKLPDASFVVFHVELEVLVVERDATRLRIKCDEQPAPRSSVASIPSRRPRNRRRSCPTLDEPPPLLTPTPPPPPPYPRWTPRTHRGRPRTHRVHPRRSSSLFSARSFRPKPAPRRQDSWRDPHLSDGRRQPRRVFTARRARRRARRADYRRIVLEPLPPRRWARTGSRSVDLWRSMPGPERSRPSSASTDLVSNPARSGPSDPSRRNGRSSASRDIGFGTVDDSVFSTSERRFATARRGCRHGGRACLPVAVATVLSRTAARFRTRAACSAGMLANTSASSSMSLPPRVRALRLNLAPLAFGVALARSTLEKSAKRKPPQAPLFGHAFEAFMRRSAPSTSDDVIATEAARLRIEILFRPTYAQMRTDGEPA